MQADSLRLIPINAHDTRQPCSWSQVSNGSQKEDKIITALRIFMGLSWELYYQQNLECSVDGRP